MDWLERMNAAMDYIENHITEEIDCGRIGQIVGCPYYHFQRMFAFMTEVSLSEYIRRRRLTLAAFELQHSQQSVIDIAFKYRYESHSSFTRAFNELHGVAPSTVRKPGTSLKAYPRMSFHISVSGGTAMSYRVENRPAFSAVGIEHRVKTGNSFNDIPRIWESIRENGVAQRLLDFISSESGKRPGGIMGILAGGSWGNGEEFSYYTAVSYEKVAPTGMMKVDFSESRWVVFEVPVLADLPQAWKRLYTDWIPTSGYCLADLPAIECYYPPGYHPQNELWIPIK